MGLAVVYDLIHAYGTIASNCRFGALREIRTPDPRNRNPMLYPAELGARPGLNTGFIGFFKHNGSLAGRQAVALFVLKPV